MNSLKYNGRKLIFSIDWNTRKLKDFPYIKMYIKIFEGDEYDEIYKVLSTLKNKELKKNNTLIDINKDMLKNPTFEQNKYSLTSTGIYRIGHDSIWLIKWICYYNRSYYEKINYHD